MGNSFVGGKRKTTKVMKINGETFKLKTPVKALEVTKNYPNHVLLESESVKHFGIRAKPLQAHQNLEPKRLYFLVVLPDHSTDNNKFPRRVRSGIEISAKDRLESLMLARRSTSDLTLMKLPLDASKGTGGEIQNEDSPMRVKMRLPRAEMERLMKESENKGDVVAEKIMDLYLKNRKASDNVDDGKQKQVSWSNNNGNGTIHGRFEGAGFKREKRVSFIPLPINEGGIHNIAVATY
ncbi:hypothetical protein ACFE04_017030 [Oxalis oulophora]